MLPRSPARRVVLALACAALVGPALVSTSAGGPAGAQEAPAAGEAPPAVALLPVPSPLPAGAPGTLIAERSFPSGDFGFEVEAHQVLFHSTDRRGHDIAVSGVVLVPTGVPAPADGRRVVAWAHGTTGLVDGCAPSLDNQEGGRLNSPDSYDRVDDLLAAGHIVTASDYPGLGTPGVHPYLDGDGEARSVLDSIRLARAYGGNDRAVIEGFSQGSQAALFAGQIWATYAPEIDLRAVVAIGTPSLFGSAFGALELPVVQSYIGKVLAGIVAGHPELDRTQILTPAGEASFDRFAATDTIDGECTSPEFDLQADLRSNPMDVPAWRAAFEADYPGKVRIPVPVLMVQSEADEQALASLADGVCRDLEANGTDLRMWRYATQSHVETVGDSATDRMQWILDRLDPAVPLADGVAFTGEAPKVLTTCPGDATPTTDPATPPDAGTPGARPAVPAPALPGTADLTG